ncbi:MAG: hypothetical protein JNM78_05050 [Cyclobacteriaceae bacterium]|nr:hypothetical protein [Cyclobacteriaceae bacterium]
MMGLITRESGSEPLSLNVKSEDPYLKYEGKIIRHINLQSLGFDKIVIDTTRNVESLISHAANKVHSNTRKSVVRNNLFIRAGKPLNPYRIADNERTLRNLPFILDARIYVKPVLDSPDSIDLLVVTRDIFSLGGSVSARIPSVYKVNIKNVNVGGWGQRAQVGQVFDNDRTPRYGYEAFYQLTNITGSFLDATVAYTKLNHGISIGNEDERSVYFKLSRELYQPFARFAGSIELGDNVSRNVYNKPDSTFIQYHYSIQDYWMGYSFGYKKMPNNLRENRNRKFIAIRSIEQRFLSPIYVELIEPDRFAYRNRLAFLTELTFFRQDFYKTQYVAGFGRTEDIPYGYRISFTAGWERELANQRPYAGSVLKYNKVLPSGTILSYEVKFGGYLKKQHVEDVLFSANFTRYSKIQRIGRMIVRHRYESGYAALFNQNVKRCLDIRDMNGLIGFKPDSLIGLQRVTFGNEVTVFTPLKILGFRIAPIARIDLALIKRSAPLFKDNNLFSGFSLGLLARNENLILNTIGARVYFYPKTVEQVNAFRFNITSNFRIRYPTNLVNKPATVFP